MHQAAYILAALWAGSLWTICGVVAPTLFASIDDRRLAGELAGLFFRVETWLGVVLGVALLVLVTANRTSRRGVAVLIALTAGAPLASELVLGPAMSAAREAGNMSRFGMLHSVSAALFALACGASLALLWRINRPAE